MKFYQIRALVAINQCGSINEASQILHVTQPALSRSIKDMERELGLTLLQRSYKGMSLTEEGRRIIRHAQMAVESMRRLQIEADNIHDMAVGEVAIGVTSLTAMLPGFEQCISDFQAKNERVRIKLTEQRPSHIVQRLRDGTLDFALTSQQNTQRLNLDWEALHRIQGAVVCGPDNPLRHSRSLRQLQYANWNGLTVNRLFGSGLAAVLDAARAVHVGEGELFIAGGAESISRAPFVIAKAQSAYSRDFNAFDSTISRPLKNSALTAPTRQV